MSDERIVVSQEYLDALMKRYHVLGAIVVGSSQFIQYLYDEQGNELRLTVKAGGDATYREISKEPTFHNGLSHEQIIELVGHFVEVYIPQSRSWEQRYVVGVDFNSNVVEVYDLRERETYSYPGNARRKLKLHGDEIYSRLRLLKVVESEAD